MWKKMGSSHSDLSSPSVSLGNTDVTLFSFSPASLCQNLSNILSDTFHHVINARYHFWRKCCPPVLRVRGMKGERSGMAGAWTVVATLPGRDSQW